MKIVTTNSGVEIKIYSSAKDMPIGRYSDFQKYLSQSIGIEGVGLIMNRAKAFLQESDFEAAELEINNAITACLSLKNGVGLHTYAFAVLVAEMGGKQANDTTIDGLDHVLAELSRHELTQQNLEDSIEEVKKKSLTS